MAALLMGLTTKSLLFLVISITALRVRTIPLALAAVFFGLALIGAIHRTADTYLRDQGLVYESALVQNHVGSYSVARVLDYAGVALGALFLIISWNRRPRSRSTEVD